MYLQKYVASPVSIKWRTRKRFYTNTSSWEKLLWCVVEVQQVPNKSLRAINLTITKSITSTTDLSKYGREII